MKKFARIFLILTALLVMLCACTSPLIPNIHQNDDHEKNNQNIPENPPDGNTVPDDGKDFVYIVPTVFYKSYEQLSVLRNTFFDTIYASAQQAPEDLWMSIDTHFALEGETDFVYISTCGFNGADNAIKTALAMAGCSDVVFVDNGSGSYTVTASYDDDGTDVECRYDISFDAENDRFVCVYNLGGEVDCRFASVRIEGGYAVQYIGDSVVNQLVYDNGDGAMGIKSDAAMLDLSGFDTSNAESFVNEGAMKIFKVSGTEFSSVISGKTYTYPKLTGEN